MPYTVERSFDAFYENINLGGDHRETANTRRDDIVNTLGKTFSIVEAFSSGSIPKYYSGPRFQDNGLSWTLS